MKTRHLLIGSFIVVLTIGGAFSVFAFGRKGGPGRMPLGRGGMFSAEGMIERLGRELELTDEQKAQLLPLVEEKMSQMREGFKKGFRSGRREFQERGRQMWQEAETQLADILTETQMQKLREMKEARMGQFGFAGRAGRFQQMMGELDMTPEQKEDMLKIFSDHQEIREKGMQNFLDIHAAMSDILSQEEFDEQKVRELFQQQAPRLEERFVEHAKMLSDMKAVLSPEQVETLQKRSADFIGKMQQRRTKGQLR